MPLIGPQAGGIEQISPPLHPLSDSDICMKKGLREGFALLCPVEWEKGGGRGCRKRSTTSRTSPQLCQARSSLAWRPEALSASTHVDGGMRKGSELETSIYKNCVSGKVIYDQNIVLRDKRKFQKK